MECEALPKDMQIEVLKRLDMDGRIRCGIVSKLRVPSHLQTRLAKLYTFKNCVFRSNDHFLLYAPYNNYILGIGPHPTDKWLDEWYEKEWPFHREWLDQLKSR